MNELPSRSGEEWFETACAHASLVGRPERDGSGKSNWERAAKADRAMLVLRTAVEMGHRSRDLFRLEEALDPLRNRADFKLLMMDLAMPNQPFAQAK